MLQMHATLSLQCLSFTLHNLSKKNCSIMIYSENFYSDCKICGSTENVVPKSTLLTSKSETGLAVKGSKGSFSLDDTLDMINSPWTTETWSRYTGNSPQSATSYGIRTPYPNSDGGPTLILYEGLSWSKSAVLLPLSRKNSPSDTLSSWTLETFSSTSSLTDLIRSQIKIKYPWSPRTSDNESDIYPPSESTSRIKYHNISSKHNNMLKSSSNTNIRMNLNNYLLLDTKDKNSFLDWIPIKVNVIPKDYVLEYYKEK